MLHCYSASREVAKSCSIHACQLGLLFYLSTCQPAKSVPIFQLGVSTLARWHVKHAGTQARWPVNHAGTQARWHVDYVSRQARMKCDLVNSPRGFYLIRCLVLTGFSKIRCNETFPACSKSLFQAVGFLVKVRAQL